MNCLTRYFVAIVTALCCVFAYANEVDFDVKVTVGGVSVTQKSSLKDLAGGDSKTIIPLSGEVGQSYKLAVNYKSLPSNRSYPGNLDITLIDVQGNKLGYLFFAINDLSFLQRVGEFGFKVGKGSAQVDVQFIFEQIERGQLAVSQLLNERLFQDTLVPKFGFQMIRPVILPQVSATKLSQTYALDKHPFAVNYTLVNKPNRLVEFQHNLYSTAGNQASLIAQFYFQVSSLEVLRELMYAGKFFDPDAGDIKLVFYPAMGQTEPAR